MCFSLSSLPEDHHSIESATIRSLVNLYLIKHNIHALMLKLTQWQTAHIMMNPNLGVSFVLCPSNFGTFPPVDPDNHLIKDGVFMLPFWGSLKSDKPQKSRLKLANMFIPFHLDDRLILVLLSCFAAIKVNCQGSCGITNKLNDSSWAVEEQYFNSTLSVADKGSSLETSSL